MKHFNIEQWDQLLSIFCVRSQTHVQENFLILIILFPFSFSPLFLSFLYPCFLYLCPFPSVLSASIIICIPYLFPDSYSRSYSHIIVFFLFLFSPLFFRFLRPYSLNLSFSFRFLRSVICTLLSFPHSYLRNFSHIIFFLFSFPPLFVPLLHPYFINFYPFPSVFAAPILSPATLS
jgi:hypothetical protein